MLDVEALGQHDAERSRPLPGQSPLDHQAALTEAWRFGLASGHIVAVQCEFCGKPGCHWTQHDDAWADVRFAERAYAASTNE